jgi:galactose mutarotase-like enzyme
MTASGLTASVLAHGAELCSLRLPTGAELIWQAGPAWPRHAPNLFPIVGRLNDDHLITNLWHYGRASFLMKQHGFARDRRFSWLARDKQACRLCLQDDAKTRQSFPFAFRLEIDYALSSDGLSVTYQVENPGNETLPFSIGGHPAFCWPLTPGADQVDHHLIFAQPEPGPIRRLRHGLLQPDHFPTPIVGRNLPLNRELFDEDAVILDQVQSRSLRYLGPDGAGIELSWHGFTELGLWSRDGGDFLCIEPWAGYASPEDFDGDFEEKPGIIALPPQAVRTFGWQVKPISP